MTKGRYYSENMNPKELKDYYQAMLKFWTFAKDKSAITYYTNKLKEIRSQLTLNCPRCNAPVFIKLPKEEWKNPKYPIYECQSCSYNEERFD